MKPTKISLGSTNDGRKSIAPVAAPPSNSGIPLLPRTPDNQYASSYSTMPQTAYDDYYLLFSDLSLDPNTCIEPEAHVYGLPPIAPYVPGPVPSVYSTETDSLAQQYRRGVLGAVPSPHLTAPPLLDSAKSGKKVALSHRPRHRRSPSAFSEVPDQVHWADTMAVASPTPTPAPVHDHFWAPPQEYPPPCVYTFDEGPAHMPGSQAYYKSKAYKQRHGDQDAEMGDAGEESAVGDGDEMDVDVEKVKSEAKRTAGKARKKSVVSSRVVKIRKVGKKTVKVFQGKGAVKRDPRRKVDIRQRRYEARR